MRRNKIPPYSGNDKETISIELDKLPAGKYPEAFDQIAPGFHDNLANISIEQAFTLTQVLNQHFNALHLEPAATPDASKNPVHSKSVVDSKSTVDSKLTLEITKWNVWVLGIGAFSRSSGFQNMESNHNDAGGFLGGADYRWNDNFVTGMHVGYNYTYGKYTGGSHLDGDSVLFGGYASYAKNGYYADATVGGGHTGFDTSRSIKFSTIDRTAHADPNRGLLTASLNLGKDFKVRKFTLGPIIGVQYTHVGIGGFSENGADSLNLALARQNADSLLTTLGGRVAYTLELNKNITLTPEVRMQWNHEFLNNSRNINASLDGGNGESFDFATSDPYRSSVFSGAGVTARFGKDISGSVFYNVNFGSQHYVNNIISASMNISF